MDAAPTRNRPWYRLHLLTYLVLLVPLGVLVLVGVPGYTVIGVHVWWGPGAGTAYYQYQEHGWPLVHLDRKAVVGPAPQSGTTVLGDSSLDDEFRSASSLRRAMKTGTQSFGGPDSSGWRDPASWKQTGTAVAVHKAALAVNLLVAVAICAAIAGPYEWWRRRRFRYSLRSLLVMFVMAAAIFGWCRWQFNQRSREKAVIDRVERLGFCVSSRYWGPIWLARLAGENHLDV